MEWAGRDATSAFQSAHRRVQPKSKYMIGRLASKVAEVEADKKGSFLKNSLKRRMDQDQRTQDITPGKNIGFAPLGQGPNASMADLERKKVVEQTNTLRLVMPEEENHTGEDKPTEEEKRNEDKTLDREDLVKEGTTTNKEKLSKEEKITEEA